MRCGFANTCPSMTYMHVIESLVDLLESSPMSDKLINPELPVEVVINDSREFGSSLDTSESGSTPYSTSNKLESVGHLY